MTKHKIGEWEYPYKVWPEDFPYKGIFSEEFIAEQITKNGFPNTENFKIVFRTALENAARNYFGELYFYGKGTPSDKDMRRHIANLSEVANGLKIRLDELPLALFEEFVEASGDRIYEEDDPYELEGSSHYELCRFNSEVVNLPTPTLKEFYQDHEGFAKFCEIKQRLQQDLADFSDICDKSPRYNPLHSRQKSMGPQRRAVNLFAYSMILFWEYFSGKKAKRYKIDGINTAKSECLDFLEPIFNTLNETYQSDIKPKFKPLDRIPLNTKLAEYIRTEQGKRKHLDDRERFKDEVIENLSLYQYSSII